MKIRKIIAIVCVLGLLTGSLTACGSGGDGAAGELYIYNWGEYFDPDALAMFEEETGIQVTYDEY